MPSQSDMTKSNSSRIQSSQAKNNCDMSSGGFASRAQSAGDRNMSGSSGSSGSQKSSTGSNNAGNKK
ncbi:hypothetical protein QBC38DRAFT_464861 [Podospora fimiseda]|uniref:SMP domain-containing protein n=1 Tax=Podospora fimiseda TaxID=252190 RepID=A0AAN7BYB6_9PEZI|nr:hypothetical protein QBC38DRAFT_464861 [Podospora fimiseda]